MQLLPRDASTALRRLARGFPVVAVTGPRQSGKTTLVRATFPGKAYVSLEDHDVRPCSSANFTNEGTSLTPSFNIRRLR
jgi:hypothetical protein